MSSLDFLSQPVRLTGHHVTLLPLLHAHHDQLVEAVKDGELWNLWYTNVPEPAKMESEIERRLDLQRQGSMLPFTVIENRTGEAVGMTTYMNIDLLGRRLEIGSTWYRKRVQRTGVNTESKLLLLAHAFEELNCVAVEFRTASLNHQSRRGIERLGAKLDGILRNHRFFANGTLRDTCVYSIIGTEWPPIKAHLTWQLAKAREAS